MGAVGHGRASAGRIGGGSRDVAASIFKYSVEYMSRRHRLPPRAFKDTIYGQFARITKALASPVRLEIVDVLAQGERSVESLAREVDQSVANASQHLRNLKAAHLVETRREGTFVFYRLADERVIDVWRAVRALGERQLAELERAVEALRGAAHEAESIDAAALLRRLAEGDVILLDVRPEAEYRAGHIAGARSLPVSELEEHLAELPPEVTVVAYCRGRYCLMSDAALAVLREHGRHGLRLAEGLPDWRAAGLPVEADRELV